MNLIISHFGTNTAEAGTPQRLDYTDIPLAVANAAPRAAAPQERGPPSPQQVASTQRVWLPAEHRKHEDLGHERAMAAGSLRSGACLRSAADSEVRSAPQSPSAPGARASEPAAGRFHPAGVAARRASQARALGGCPCSNSEKKSLRRSSLCGVKFRLAALCLTLFASLLHAAPRELDVLIVLGASGTEEYGKKFQTQVEAWKTAATKGGVPAEIISGNETTAKLEQRFAAAAANPARSLWLVLIGHGTFDGREAKFSAEGPDFDAKQLAGWIKPLKQEVAIIHTASTSGGFLKGLSGKNRVVITSTKSPDEVFYARFGEYFAEAIGGLPEADQDQDKQVSLLEAFRYASKATATFYENDGRLATEHALLEDNGDGIGTRSEVFTADAPAPAGMAVDGARAAQLVLVLSAEEQQLTDAQRSTRDALERELKTLKDQRSKLKEDDYYTKLESLLRKLGEVYAKKS